MRSPALQPFDKRQRLRAAVTQGNEQTTPRRELLDQWRRDLRASGGNQYRIVRGVGAPPQRPVPQQHGGFGDSCRAHRSLGPERKPLNTFDAEHLVREGAQQRRLIA